MKKIEKDNKGRVISITNDKYREEIIYNDETNEPKRIETWYPGGQHEVERYGSWK